MGFLIHQYLYKYWWSLWRRNNNAINLNSRCVLDCSWNRSCSRQQWQSSHPAGLLGRINTGLTFYCLQTGAALEHVQETALLFVVLFSKLTCHFCLLNTDDVCVQTIKSLFDPGFKSPYTVYVPSDDLHCKCVTVATTTKKSRGCEAGSKQDMTQSQAEVFSTSVCLMSYCLLGSMFWRKAQ